jgi:CMP-N,N'-diacetyllegionaminic acid synthase
MVNNTLFLIPARSGSKSIVNKNIKVLGSIPLLAYRIKQALSLTSSENVWLSTDSPSYAKIGQMYGATIPFIRPIDLALDTSSSNDVVLNAMCFASENNLKFEFVALLEPTSPFVYPYLIKEALLRLKQYHNAGSIVGTKIVHTNSIFVQNDSEFLNVLHSNLLNKSSLNRQSFPDQITPSGGFYISKWEDFLINKSFYTPNTLNYRLPEECTLEIDNPIDWNWAEFLIEKNIINLNKLFSNEI